jgi:small subunit ribosomal protein S18
MARDKDRRKGARDNDRRRIPKKKTSVLVTENIQWVDYKDVNLLRRFMSERAKIRARRVTGNTAQQQRAVAQAIRIAREMALLPYSVRQVTQRSKGGRRDRDRDREPREAREAREAPPTPTEGPAPVDVAAEAPPSVPDGAPDAVPDAPAPDVVAADGGDSEAGG